MFVTADQELLQLQKRRKELEQQERHQHPPRASMAPIEDAKSLGAVLGEAIGQHYIVLIPREDARL